MKELIKQYLDNGVSRRELMRGLSAVGIGAVAAKGLADALGPMPAEAVEAAAASGLTRQVQGTGGMLFIQQLKSAGVEYFFFNPSTGDAPIYDALAVEPGIQVIKGVQEGAVVAMADGYARISGKIGVASIANIGLPNGMTQLVNSYKDGIPVLLTVAQFGQDDLGRDGPQDYDHQETMLQPITKYYWLAQTAGGIPETTRRAIKFAATPPSGPVFLSIPDNLLKVETSSMVMDQSLFAVSMKMRPDKDDIEKAAKLLIEAKNPLMTIGDEVTLCHAEKEVVELAELLGMPVADKAAQGSWSKPFPTRHPLLVGSVLGNMRFPGDTDVRLNIGNKYAERRANGAVMISMRRDPASLARVGAVDLGIVADLKLATADLITAIKSMATKERLKQIADDRSARVRDYTSGQAKMRQIIATDLSSGSEIRMERLGVELEKGLEKDTIYVSDCDSGRTMDPLMSFGGSDKSYFATGSAVLGWGMAAAFGAKLARPDRPVVAVVGDGSFLFSGPQPLWSQARYKAPITVIVLNNHSYNNERNRIWNGAGRQFEAARDMTCYNGSPDVDYAKAASAFGVEGETVKEPAALAGAFTRAKAATVEGRPYLLDIHIKREGIGAVSQWYPPYSLADQRTRKV